jgi:hypothetical protein
MNVHPSSRKFDDVHEKVHEKFIFHMKFIMNSYEVDEVQMKFVKVL